VSASDLAIVAALVFAWDTLSARLERFDVTAPLIFVAAGLVLTHGPLAMLGSRLPPRRSRFWRRSRLSWCCSLMRPGSGCGNTTEGSPAASAALEYLRQCEASGDFAAFSAENQSRWYSQYYTG
jgi:hypothetical protein